MMNGKAKEIWDKRQERLKEARAARKKAILTGSKQMSCSIDSVEVIACGNERCENQKT
jgi:hypothetical protein